MTGRRKSRKKVKKSAQKGGIPIFAGAQGCVFKPALKCKHEPRNDADDNISKLEEKESAEAEMREYDQIKQHLQKIKDYERYFSMKTHMCEPDVLEPRDLVNFDKVCINMQHAKISAANVNANLGKLRMINMPDLGVDLKQWMEQTPLNAHRIIQLNDHISNLLIRAVAPMNRLGVIHNDLKSENAMIDRRGNARIIDWGLAGITTPHQIIPVRHFMNNPVTFNRPFSTMVISPKTCELYASVVLKSTPSPTMEQLKHFTRAVYKEYIDMYDSTGYKYFQYIFNSMFGSSDEVLIDAVATYNAQILHHFTDLVQRKFRLNEYFSKVYRYNTDVWGLMSVFYSMFMMPRNGFAMSDAAHANMLQRYRTLFRTVVFANGHERMNVAHIVEQLRQINDAIRVHVHPAQKRTVRFNLKPRHNDHHNTIKRVPTPYHTN
jgi:tRNA A-37 threonylcarbamoyl transferase component Bud32